MRHLPAVQKRWGTKRSGLRKRFTGFPVAVRIKAIRIAGFEIPLSLRLGVEVATVVVRLRTGTIAIGFATRLGSIGTRRFSRGVRDSRSRAPFESPQTYIVLLCPLFDGFELLSEYECRLVDACEPPDRATVG